MGNIRLTNVVKIVYNFNMVGSVIIFVLRICLIATIWAAVWRYVEPKTGVMRVLRAALLVVALLLTLAAMKTLGV